MSFTFAKRISKVQDYYFVKKLQQINEMRLKGIEVINLGIGSPDLSPPQNALRKANETIISSGVHGYQHYKSTPELRTAISQWYNKIYQVNLNPEKEVLPLLGSKEGILYLSMAMCNPGDKILVPNPGYPTYSSVADLLDIEIIYYDLLEENNWMVDFDQLKKFDLKNCKIMWCNYPHMPSGTAITQNEFLKIKNFCEKNSILLCNDNPYGLILNKTKPLSVFSVDNDKNFSCEMNSMSKTFSMAGWRVGMFLGNESVVNAVLRVKSNVDSGMYLGIQKAAIEALGADQSYYDENNSIYEKRRELIYQIYDLLNLTYKKNQVGLFVWGKAPQNISNVSDYLDDLLLKANVFLTPGKIFGSNGDRYIRASLCAKMEDLEKAKSKIKDYLK